MFWFFQNNNLEHSSTLCCYTFHLAFDSEEIYVWILILLSTCKILKQLKIKCKFSFLLEVLLSCSNVKINPQNKKIKLQTFKKKEKKNNWSVPNQSPPRARGAPLFAQVSLSPLMAQEAQPSPQHSDGLAHSPTRPPSTHRAATPWPWFN